MVRAIVHHVSRRSPVPLIDGHDLRDPRCIDVDVTNDRLRERIPSVKIEQADLKNRLTRTDDVLERGAKTLLTYVEMLADPERLYRDSPNRIRRLLLEAFSTTETRERAPGHRTRGSESNLESRLANFFAVKSSSKANLVGRVGLEPTTDGL